MGHIKPNYSLGFKLQIRSISSVRILNNFEAIRETLIQVEFALSEKTKLTILKDRETEEPIVTSSFVTHMKDHEIECVLLDDIMERPTKVSTVENQLFFENLPVYREFLKYALIGYLQCW